VRESAASCGKGLQVFDTDPNERSIAMRKSILFLSFIIAVALGAPAAAQMGAAVVGKGPGVAGAAQTVKLTATITKINAKTREVTLKGPQGKEVTIVAGPEVKNFAHMKVGDQVDVEYVEALTLELKKGSKEIVSRTDTGAAGRAKPGQMPGAAAGREVRVVAEVIGLDPATQTVTLRGPQHTVELQVRDPAQFKLISMGDKVEAIYTEAIAVSVQAPAAKK
jgi:Cu/Ag efflux protein CusF